MIVVLYFPHNFCLWFCHSLPKGKIVRVIFFFMCWPTRQRVNDGTTLKMLNYGLVKLDCFDGTNFTW